ncbi:MAG TPA: hypothetical protein VKP64_16030 [Mycobacteriales bacterium]|nr:hypothetical protein [Mycobacteriales bacterium]
MVSGGVAAFLASRDDPYEWLGSLEAFGASGNHFTGRIETLRDLLDPTWVDGRRQYSHDGGPLRFTGSHYLDLLQVRDITPEGGASFLDTPFGGRLNAPLAPGKLVLMLHAHGTNFGQVLRENALRRVGMSHNLKRYLHRHAQASRQEAAAVTTMEVRAAGHGALGKRLRHRPHIEETTHRAISNPRVADLVASMAATGSIVPLASMRPVLRLHTVRPGEKPFAARAAQGGVR